MVAYCHHVLYIGYLNIVHLNIVSFCICFFSWLIACCQHPAVDFVAQTLLVPKPCAVFLMLARGAGSFIMANNSFLAGQAMCARELLYSAGGTCAYFPFSAAPPVHTTAGQPP